MHKVEDCWRTAGCAQGGGLLEDCWVCTRWRTAGGLLGVHTQGGGLVVGR